jgi:large subunit ribosomal protein L35
MPKLKTRKAAAKRFRVSGSGDKILRRKAFKNHLLQHKSAERKHRRLSQLALVDERDEANVRLMLPYL